LLAVNIQMCECSEGDILAADVFSKAGVKLVACDTTLNLFILQKMRKFDIDSVEVYNHQFPTKSSDYRYKKLENGYRETTLLVKNIINGLATDKKLDCDKVMEASEIICQYVIDSDNDNIVKCLTNIKSTDEYTYIHSVNVAFYSMLIAKWMGLSESDVRKAVQSGLLHDIGKAKVPLDMLNKKAPLTKEEFNIIKKHPVYGYYILDESNFVDIDIKRAVLLHHERVNRSGYPFNISASSIGILTRIVSVADVYDAMTSNRVYKRKATPFAAFEMFLTEGYTNFDTFVTSEFVNHMSAYLTGVTVLLSNGQTGKIAYVPPQDVLSPIICSNGDYFGLKEKGLAITDLL